MNGLSGAVICGGTADKMSRGASATLKLLFLALRGAPKALNPESIRLSAAAKVAGTADFFEIAGGHGAAGQRTSGAGGFQDVEEGGGEDPRNVEEADVTKTPEGYGLAGARIAVDLAGPDMEFAKGQ